jgi:hypothetical protein
MPTYHLAQINIGRTIAPVDSPLIADFMNALDEINALAEATPGFVWRLQTDDGNATALKPYDDPLIIVNMSVWDSVESLKAYAYKSRHVDFVRRRHEWFETFERPYMALWWIPAGQIPTVMQDKARLQYLQQHGPTVHAFNFQTPFAPSDSAVELPAESTDSDKTLNQSF